jgi:hypothetical protein
MKDLVLNFTNRVDLLPVDVSATYSVIENLCTLKLGWQLGHYGFESTAEIVVDIRVKGSTEARRLNIGKIDNGFGEKTFELANMRNPELMELRFKVVHSNFGEMPMLRASLDRITPVDVNPNNRSKSFFKIVKQDELSVPWRLYLEDNEPILYISGRQEMFRQLRDSTPLFSPLVLPELIRQIFDWIAFVEIDGSNKVQTQWVAYFEALGCPNDFLYESRDRGVEEDVENVWQEAQRVSDEFSKKFKIINTISEVLESEID